MRGSLDQLRNLGPVTARRLEAVGVRDPDDLARLGAAAAFVAVRGAHPERTSLTLLWALEGALRDRDWRDLGQDDKHRLRDAVDVLDADP